MKNNGLLTAASIVFYLTASPVSKCSAEQPAHAAQSKLDVTPELSTATLDNAYANIVFSVKNISAGNLLVDTRISLMTSDNHGEMVPVEEFMAHPYPLTASDQTPRFVLRPGETGTFNGSGSMKTLAFLLEKKKEITGAVRCLDPATNRIFRSYSAQFAVPAKLTTPPWIDLGEQNYFVVTPDFTRALIYGPQIADPDVIRTPQYSEVLKSGWADMLLFPVEIKNTANQEYVVANDSVRFYIVRGASGRTAPSPWETIKASKQTLKPGETATSTGRCHIRLDKLELEGYKPGDKIVAAVGGRIPNTNQIFECYSAPFVLPPLPASRPHESKPDVQRLLKRK